MRIKPVLLATGIALLGSTALAQSQQSNAETALSKSQQRGDLFQQNTVQEIVTPFETSNPKESGYNHTTFEDRILETREADETQGRVLRATEDSSRVRPEVDIDGQGALFDDANWAHENADDVAGQYFTSETGSCETPNLPVSDRRDEFCESLPRQVKRSCDLIRKIWVDRTDTYRCDRRASNFVKVCERTNKYQCKVNGSAAACIQRKVKITGGKVTWSGKTATISFNAPSRKPSDGNSYLKIHKFSVQIADRFAPEEARLSKVVANGAVQVLAGNKVIGTWSRNRSGNFMTAPGSLCPKNDRDGILIPFVKSVPDDAWQCKGWGRNMAGQKTPFAALVKGSRKNTPEGAARWKLPILDVVEYGNDKVLQWFICQPRYDTERCNEFQDLSGSVNVSKNVLRFLDLNTYSSTRPDQDQRWRKTDFTVRVVYPGGSSSAGSAKISIKFDGPCCDRFTNTGSETCE